MSHDQFEHDQAVELRALKIENERLKEENRITVSVCNENTDLKKLIIELCDALEEEYGEGINLEDRHPWNLMKRAREATHGH